MRIVDIFHWLIEQEVIARARKICLLIYDVDGVLSDRLIFIDNHGEELTACNVCESYGIRCMKILGSEVAIIIRLFAKLLENRAKTLGISYRDLYQG